jgi:hypothetical protein
MNSDTITTEAPAPAATIRILEWRAVHSGNLIGVAKVALPGGVVLIGCQVLNGVQGPWVSPPSRPVLGRDGCVQRDANGKQRFAATVEFASRALRDRFSAGVIAALRAAHPEAFR